MCRTKMATKAAEPEPRPTRNAAAAKHSASALSSSDPSTSNPASSWQTRSLSSQASLSGLREYLPENPHIYDFSEVRAATNSFLAKPYSPSPSTPCWRCCLRGREVIVFQRKLRREIPTARLQVMLSVICRSHHVSLIKLLGVSISGGQIYLVYDFVRDGASLADSLRNPRNPNFTILSTWISRMRVAADVADGLDYIHNSTGLYMNLVHNHIRSNSIVVTEKPALCARICHFGTAELCGEPSAAPPLPSPEFAGEITWEDSPTPEPRDLARSRSGTLQFEGVTGYMAPELPSTGVATQQCDVYAFGVVLLELLSGSEPVKFRFDRGRRDLVRTSVIETATAAVEGGGGGAEGRVRAWVDRRLGDSFPVDVAGRLTRLALECVRVDPDGRPGMRRVAGKVSRLYLESKRWCDSLRVTEGISLSYGPR